MKNYKEMADAVFRRRDEYAAEQKRKKKIALSASLSLCAVCLATLGAFGIWRTGILEPDPSIIGTKPPSITESTEVSEHTLGSNATSEGDYSENTEVVSGNSTAPTEADSLPQATTDPVENPTVNPVRPTVRPTLPTLPIGPQLPPTSGDTQYPDIVIPTVPPLATDPVETEAPTAATDSNSGEVPPTGGDPKPPAWVPSTEVVPVTTAAPSTTNPDFAKPDEVPGEEPETVCPTMAPTEPMDTPSAVPDEPTVPPTDPTEAPAASNPAAEETTPNAEYLSAFGKVVDEDGNGIKGAKVALYRGSTLVSTCTTGANGSFSFEHIKYSADLKVRLSSVPSAYNLNTKTIYVTQSTGSDFVFTCTKK